MTDLIAAVAAGHAKAKAIEAEWNRLQTASAVAKESLNAARAELDQAERRLTEAARAYKVTVPAVAPAGALPAPALPPPPVKPAKPGKS